MRIPAHHLMRLERLAVLLVAGTFEALAGAESQPARRIVVSIPSRKVALVENGSVVKTWPAAVGASATPTPAGVYEVVHRIPHPTWYPRGRVVPPGKANPLGTRWIGLSRKGYGIHGTNNPGSVGKPASLGCVRLRNADVEELFDRIAVGDTVELYDTHTPELDRIFGEQLAAVVGGGD
jgi:lipoprotein-anchoring transpeptidase ErfK/SrfK